MDGRVAAPSSVGGVPASAAPGSAVPGSASSGVLDEFEVASLVWAALTPLLAGRPVVRESRDGGRNYHAKWQRPLTGRVLLSVPAAVPVYSAAGDTRVLVVDLDCSRGGRGQVLRDAAAIGSLVTAAGGRLISDGSPSGGVHLYVPLAEPVGFYQARDVAKALAARAPSMDVTPNLGLTNGLIRPPGSRHRSKGFQVLHGPLNEAVALARVGNPPVVWQRLSTELAPELAAQTTPPDLTSSTADLQGEGGRRVPRRGGVRELAADYLRIATTGVYDTGRYPTASHARQAVITAAVWAGHDLSSVLGRLHAGRWPGLRAFYTRYRTAAARRQALARDWSNAVALVTAAKAHRQTQNLVRQSPTSGPDTHRGVPDHGKTNRNTQSEFRFLRTWQSAMALAELDDPGRAGWMTARMVLRAVGQAARMSGSRYVHFGTRSLSIGAGVDHTTVAAHLRALREGPDALIELIDGNRGVDGDLYELVLPARYADRAGRRDWRGGKLHALRPVFLELGIPAALVYEALEHAKEPLTSFDLTASVGLSRSAVYEALETLAAFHLAAPRRGRWVLVAATSLTALAEQLGIAETIHRQVLRHRHERAAYRLVLHIADRHRPAPPTAADWYDRPPPQPPPHDEESLTALSLLERILGAHPIPA